MEHGSTLGWFYACSLFNVCIAMLHGTFWRTIASPQELRRCSPGQAAFIHIANIQLILTLLIFAYAYGAHADEMRSTGPGRVMTIGFLCFWLARTLEQFIFGKWQRPSSWVLTLSVIIHAGAALKAFDA